MLLARRSQSQSRESEALVCRCGVRCRGSYGIGTVTKHKQTTDRPPIDCGRLCRTAHWPTLAPHTAPDGTGLPTRVSRVVRPLRPPGARCWLGEAYIANAMPNARSVPCAWPLPRACGRTSRQRLQLHTTRCTSGFSPRSKPSQPHTTTHSSCCSTHAQPHQQTRLAA